MSDQNIPEQPEGAARDCVQRVVSLPPEWDCFIPPAMVNVETVHAGSMVGTSPKWNPQWLAGLEKYVRAIVQDELRQANDGTQRPGTPDGSLATETRKPGSLK